MPRSAPRFSLHEKVDIEGFFHAYRRQWYVGTIKKIFRKEQDGFYGPSVSYEYMVRIDAETKGANDYYQRKAVKVRKPQCELEKLHTHTPIHNYLYESTGAVCHEAKKTGYCAHCSKLCCLSCNLCTIQTHKCCGQCAPKVEHSMIYKAVATVVSTDYSEFEHFKDKLANIIACFAMGLEFPCCRDTGAASKCTNTILFDNRFQFAFDKDMERQRIYKYLIRRNFHETHRNVVDYPSVEMDNKLMQIFCAQCTANHLPPPGRHYYGHPRPVCKAKGCENKSDVDYCYNHPICFLCQKWPNPKFKRVCRDCRHWYCSECGLESKYQCKLCESSSEYEKYHSLLVSTISEVVSYDVCRMIAMYCSGFATVCCNQECENTVNINSKSEWNNHVNSEGQKVYRYQIDDEYLLPFYKIYDLFGEKGRIFCAECTAHKLMRCKLIYKHESYVATKDTEEMCKLHTFCGAGGTQYNRAHDGKYYLTQRCNLRRLQLDTSDLPYYHRYHHRRYGGYDDEDDDDDNDDDDDANGNSRREVLHCVKCDGGGGRERWNYSDNGYSDYDEDEPFLDSIYRRYSYSWRGYHRFSYVRGDEQSMLYCLYQHYIETGALMYIPNIKQYFGSVDEHKNMYHLYKDYRYVSKRKNHDKRGIWRTKNRRKRKSLLERKKDKRSNRKTNEKFKKRYQLSLQF